MQSIDSFEIILSYSSPCRSPDAAQKIVALTRLRANELPEPQSEDEMYQILADILGELLRDGKVKVADYGLSVLGHNQYQALVRRASGEAPPKSDPFAEVIRLYKTNITEFNDRRASDPEFLKRSNDAQAAGLLR